MRTKMLMFCLLAVVWGILPFATLHAQDEGFSTYYYQRKTLFEVLPVSHGAIVFLGNSITDGCEWNEFFPGKKIVNRGISGDVTRGILHRLDAIVNIKPEKVFLMIGTNDLARNVPVDTIFVNICKIATTIREQSPSTHVYVQTILPVNPTFGRFAGHTSRAEDIVLINKRLQAWCQSVKGVTFIDLHTSFLDADGYLDEKYTNDGLHLSGEGYLLWSGLIRDFVEGD